MNKELINYIKNQIQTGIERSEIDIALKSVNWRKNEINNAFRIAFLEVFLDKIKNNLPVIVKTSILVFCLTFIAGFLIWNFYLARFGFSEYELIQTRFISTGATFILFILIFTLIIKLINFLFSKCQYFLIKYTLNMLLILFILFIIACYFYSNYFFIYLPSKIGGGKPEALSIISSPEQINYLKQLDIPISENAENPPIQTGNLCVIYENKDNVIAFVSQQVDQNTTKYRILKIKKDLISGFGSIKGDPRIEVQRNSCIDFFNKKL